jgi:hypothetical protein
MEFLLGSGVSILEMLGPTLVGIITVPVMKLIKRFLGFMDGWPAWAQQISVVLIAGALTWIGTVLNAAIPTDLTLFTEQTIGVIGSASMALAIHAGKKAKQNG